MTRVLTFPTARAATQQRAAHLEGTLVPRKDLEVFECAAPAGTHAIVFEQHGTWLCRVEMLDGFYTNDFVNFLIRWVEAETEPK